MATVVYTNAEPVAFEPGELSKVVRFVGTDGTEHGFIVCLCDYADVVTVLRAGVVGRLRQLQRDFAGHGDVQVRPSRKAGGSVKWRPASRDDGLWTLAVVVFALLDIILIGGVWLRR